MMRMEVMSLERTFGTVVREARVNAGKTQRQLAQDVKKEDGAAITPQYLNDIEFDRRTPSEFVTRQIAKALDLDADRLMFIAGSLPQDIVKDIIKRGISNEKAKQISELFRKKAT
jgi:transcriptional regulator with XRE-family HTH domain